MPVLGPGGQLPAYFAIRIQPARAVDGLISSFLPQSRDEVVAQDCDCGGEGFLISIWGMHPLPSDRLLSLDAFRGFVMLLMASGGFGIRQMAAQNPGTVWQTIAPQFVHREWAGCSLWDLIQPAFMFMVGVAMAYSHARRAEAGDSFSRMMLHGAWRAVALVMIGVVLASNGKAHTDWAFTNVLAQIGLAYLFLLGLWRMGWEAQVAAFIVILAGYGCWFFWHDLPVADAVTGVTAGAHGSGGSLPGFFAHWNIHTNAAADFDRWFLNRFPRASPFEVNAGGYQTLNFIPSLATMLAGSLAGRFLHRSREARFTCSRLVVAGVMMLLAGFVAGLLFCPVVKRIWTPSWVLFSGGWVLLTLAAFYWLVEIAGQRKLVFPLVVVGMNSIFIYLMHSLCAGWIKQTLRKHISDAPFTGYWGPVVESVGVLIVLWLMCWWLYRQRVFLRI